MASQPTCRSPHAGGRRACWQKWLDEVRAMPHLYQLPLRDTTPTASAASSVQPSLLMPLPNRMSNSASLYGAAHLFFTICSRTMRSQGWHGSRVWCHPSAVMGLYPGETAHRSLLRPHECKRSHRTLALTRMPMSSSPVAPLMVAFRRTSSRTLA
jgi:hypothetical protein